MRRFSLVILLFVLALPLMGDGTAWPRLTAVTPDSGKATIEFTTTGENLAKTQVAELFLTDGKADFKVEMIEQAKDSIKFKVPETVKPGRYGLVILTPDRMQFIEQPVKVTIE